MYNKQHSTSCKRIGRETYAFLLFVLLLGVFLGGMNRMDWKDIWVPTTSFLFGASHAVSYVYIRL
jgi:hypothetical protein